MKIGKLQTALLLLIIVALANADNWQFKKELKSNDFIFGDTTVTRIIDTRQNQFRPEYKVKINVAGKDVALFKNLTFDEILTFDKGNYLLGISISGLSEFSYFIMDSTGNLLRTQNHSKKTHYCESSVTLVRQWVDIDNLDIIETYRENSNNTNPDNSDEHLQSVTVKTCDGRRVELWSQ